MQQKCQLRFLIFKVLSQRFLYLKLAIFKIFHFFEFLKNDKLSVKNLYSFVAFFLLFSWRNLRYKIAIFLIFQKIEKKPILNAKIRFFLDTIYLIFLHRIVTRSIGEQQKKTVCKSDKNCGHTKQ